MTEEKIMLRANILGGINAYIRDHIEDEKAYFSWIEDFPDECSEEELMEIAADEKQAVYLMVVGARLIGHFTDEEEDEEPTEPDDIDSDCGFDPYLGMLTWDC